MTIQQAIERLRQRIESGEPMKAVAIDDPLPEYGGGDPELADDVARAVAHRWDD